MAETRIEFLIKLVRDDISGLKADVTAVLNKHEQEIESLKRFKWYSVGVVCGVSIIFQAAAKIIEIALK